MSIRFLLLIPTILLSCSCVSSKVFNDLEARYIQLKMDKADLTKRNDSLEGEWKMLNQKHIDLEELLAKEKKAKEGVEEEWRKLREDYASLEKNSDSAIQKRIAENKALLQTIDDKEAEIALRALRVDELQEVIRNKEAALQQLKQSLSDALLNFEGKGLTVEQRNGKVYVSMENKLLFKSGRWDIGAAGKQALKQLAAVLVENPDIFILIEGHTDNQPYIGKAPLEGNWDLSTKRATAVVQLLLKNPALLPQNLTAAGRSEFLPIAPNSSADGRASNRRIEVILSPQLDEISQLLHSN